MLLFNFEDNSFSLIEGLTQEEIAEAAKQNEEMSPYMKKKKTMTKEAVDKLATTMGNSSKK